MDQSLTEETRDLVEELLDLMLNDSENLERTMNLLTDDCTWVIEPGVSEYHGSNEIRAFVDTAMSGRKHDEKHKIEVLNHFADNENLCIEYTHSAVLTGEMTAGIKGTLNPGAARYCMTHHILDGKFDRIHEYINSPSVWLSFISPIALKYLHWQTMRSLSKNADSKVVTKDNE